MKNTYKKGVIIAFGELFLKSDAVKELFKKRLVQNISFFLKKEKISFKNYLFRERIFIEVAEGTTAIKLIKDVFGISWLAECFYFPKANLKELADFIDKNCQNWIKKGETFAIRLKLESGVIKESKEKVIERLARNINRKANLSKPKKEIFVEIRRNGCFLYFKKIQAAGGYPVGSGGKVLTLMSGGIDSPVAAYSIAKKGVQNTWVHFHSFPLVSNRSIEKTKELAETFLGYQPNLKIYFIPFQKAQIEIKAKIAPSYRILLYRRLMFKISEIIAQENNCEALVTGESLGQVSSQTLPNLKIIEEAVKIPVLRPLISLDKKEIIEIAEKINTFKISIKPQEDCCTLFTPKHSSAHGKLEDIKELEKKLNIKKLIKNITKEAKIVVL